MFCVVIDQMAAESLSLQSKQRQNFGSHPNTPQYHKQSILCKYMSVHLAIGLVFWNVFRGTYVVERFVYM